MQDRAQRPHHLGTAAHHFSGLRPDDEVDVALPYPRLLGQPTVDGGQWAHRLGRHLPAVGRHRKLTAPGGDHLAVHEDVVAEVHGRLPTGQLVRADERQAQHGLQLGTVALAQRGEAELARVAQVHHPAGDTDVLTGGRVLRQVRVGVAHLAQAVGAPDGHRVRVPPLGEHLRPLGAADPQLLGKFALGVVAVGSVGRRGAHLGKVSDAVAEVRRRPYDLPA